jgi:hypothetical protein
MTELKIKSKRELDRITMQMCDLESRLLNYQKDESEIANIIYGDTKCKTLPEA